ncbi:unnamed protein product, partial [marine sediment metagenome]
WAIDIKWLRYGMHGGTDFSGTSTFAHKLLRVEDA